MKHIGWSPAGLFAAVGQIAVLARGVQLRLAIDQILAESLVVHAVPDCRDRISEHVAENTPSYRVTTAGNTVAIPGHRHLSPWIGTESVSVIGPIHVEMTAEIVKLS